MGTDASATPTGEPPASGGYEPAHEEATAVDPGTPRQPQKALAQKIDHLFHAVHPRGRGEYSLEEVAEGIRRRGGPTISATYIWQLRKGLKDNPTKKHLEALADFFGVSPLYFFDDAKAAQIETEMELLVTLREAPVRYIAMRSAGLSTQSLRAITGMIEHVRQLEGLSGSPSGTRRERRGATSNADQAAPASPAQPVQDDDRVGETQGEQDAP